MVKIAVLKQNILRIHASVDVLPISSFDAIGHDLKQWYSSLPIEMHLGNLLVLDSSGFTTQVRRVIYFVHLLALGAWILLYRCLIAQISVAPESVPHDRIAEYADEAILAAEQSARILGLLQYEIGIYKRCWISMQANYVPK